MYDLAEMYEFVHAQELYELGAAVAVGFNDPSKIEDFKPKATAQRLNMDELPAMLRIPKKRG